MSSKDIITKAFSHGKTFLGRLPQGGDLLSSIELFCEISDISTAVFSVRGALSTATFGIYDQKQQVYATEKLETGLEIINCTGNISLKNGKPSAHAHFILADSQGRTFAGHVLPETTIFAGEFHLQELLGDKLERVFDPATGLMLWDM